MSLISRSRVALLLNVGASVVLGADVEARFDLDTQVEGVHAEKSELEKPPEKPGCFVWFHKYQNTVPAPAIHSLDGCQAGCKASPLCDVFSFEHKVGEDPFKAKGKCHFGRSDLDQLDRAILNPEKHWSVVSGPEECGEVPLACTELPDSTFPADTKAKSFASWKTEYQPADLQCWKMSRENKPEACPEKTVLADVKLGWPGKCQGLAMKSHMGTEEECRKSCLEDVDCPAWTYMHNKDCYHGRGYDCYSNGTTGPIAGQRVSHGAARVLKDFSEVQVAGLTQVFGRSSMKVMQSLGQDPVAVCKSVCLSMIWCQYWQLLEKSGCYVEAVSEHAVSYPLTDKDLIKTHDTVVAGEYLQRYCPSTFPSLGAVSEVEKPVQRVKSLELPVLKAESPTEPLAQGEEDGQSSLQVDALVVLLVVVVIVSVISAGEFAYYKATGKTHLPCIRTKASKKRGINMTPSASGGAQYQSLPTNEGVVSDGEVEAAQMQMMMRENSGYMQQMPLIQPAGQFPVMVQAPQLQPLDAGFMMQGLQLQSPATATTYMQPVAFTYDAGAAGGYDAGAAGVYQIEVPPYPTAQGMMLQQPY